MWKHALVSILLAAASIATTLTTGGIIVHNELIRVVWVLPFSVAWTLVVVHASGRHGRRAMWLLLGFPFAWFEALLVAFFVLSGID